MVDRDFVAPANEPAAGEYGEWTEDEWYRFVVGAWDGDDQPAEGRERRRS